MEEKSFKILSKSKQIAVKKTASIQDCHIEVEKIDVELKYLASDGKIKVRCLRIFLPEIRTIKKIPAILGIHYEIPEDDRVIYDYINRGWAVLTPFNVPMEHLQNILEDDLLFNMAVVGFTKRINMIDGERIVLRGISAGGYQILMLAAFHLGINSAYVLCGIPNLSFFAKYIKKNNKINIGYELKLTKEEQENNDNYPLPNIRKIYNAFLPTIEALGMKDMENNTWIEFSPVSHIDEITLPILMIHSSADILVPVTMFTDKLENMNLSSDLPIEFECEIKNIMENIKLNKTLEMLLPQEDIEINVRNPPPKNGELEALKFSVGKKFCVTIVDEGKLERKCDHFKDSDNFFKFSEMDFLNYYISLPSGKTNQLTLSKMVKLSERFRGKISIFFGQKCFKVKCPHEIQGSLYSDRLDVLIDIKNFLGIKVSHSVNQELQNEICETKFCEKNLNLFLYFYSQLDGSTKFLEDDPLLDGNYFANNPIENLLKLIDSYSKKCGGMYFIS